MGAGGEGGMLRGEGGGKERERGKHFPEGTNLSMSTLALNHAFVKDRVVMRMQ